MSRRSTRVLRRFLILAAACAASFVIGNPAHASECTSPTVTWQGGSSQYWSTAANWTTNAVPGPGDRACIPAGADVTMDGYYELDSIENLGSLHAWSGMRLVSTTTPSLIGNAEVASTIAGDADIIVAAGRTLTLRGAHIYGSGTLRIDSGGTVDTGSCYYLCLALHDSHRIVNNGTLRVGNPDYYYSYGYMDPGSSIENHGLLELAGHLEGYAPGARVTNDGVIRALKDVYIRPTLVNDGAVEAASADLDLVSGVESTGAGSFQIAQGRTLSLGGSSTIADPARISGLGTLRVAGQVRFLTGGPLPTITLNGGSLGGNRDYEVVAGHPFRWNEGDIGGDGVLHVGEGAVLETSPSCCYHNTRLHDARSIVNDGTMRLGLTDGCCYLSLALDDATSIVNHGTLDLRSSLNIYRTGGVGPAPLLRNEGTLRKTSGGTTQANVRFANTGTVEVTDGDLTIEGSGSGALSGSFTVAAGRTLRFGNGTVIERPEILGGAGTYAFRGATGFEQGGDLPNVAAESTTITAPGDLNIPAGRRVTFYDASLEGTGVLHVAEGGVLESSPNSYYPWLRMGPQRSIVNDGTLRLGGGCCYGALSLTDDTTLRNDGRLELGSGAYITRTGGGAAPTISGTGEIARIGSGSANVAVPIEASISLDVPANTSLYLDEHRAYNPSTNTLRGADWSIRGTLQMHSLDIVRVDSALTLGDGFRLQADYAPDALRNFNEVGRNGSLHLDGAQLRVRSSIVNSGVIEVSGNGTLASAGSYRQAGGETLLRDPLSSLQADARTVQIFRGRLRGNGVVHGDVENEGVVQPGVGIGVLRIDGDYTQVAGGKLEADIAGRTPGSRHDLLDVSGIASLDGVVQAITASTFHPRLDDRFLVLDAGVGRVGAFATLDGAGGDGAVGYETIYDDNGVLLRGVAKLATSLSAAPVVGSSTIGAGGPTLDALLTETVSGQPVVGAEVRFSVNGEVMCVANTDSSGHARCKAPTTIVSALAAQGYEAIFAGTQYWLASSAHGKAASLPATLP